MLFAALLGFALGIAVFGLLARGDIVHEGGTASFTCASALVMPHEANDTHTGDNLGVAVAFLARNVGASAVCSLSEMRYDLGTATVTPTQMLAIAGTPSLPTAASAAAAPRLWARFEVLGTLFVTGVMIRDQAISPAPVPTAAQGAAAQVHSGGRLVATGVSFLRLRTTGSGGAVHVDGGGLAEFYGCAFDGCHSSGSGGGALFFAPTSSGIVADSLLRGCVASSRQGGAVLVVTTNPAHPLRTNVTITHTAFADNSAKFGGDDILVSGYPDVVCPAPGLACGPGPGKPADCCFDYLNTSTPLSAALPTG